jgi:hypothetical protein
MELVQSRPPFSHAALVCGAAFALHLTGVVFVSYLAYSGKMPEWAASGPLQRYDWAAHAFAFGPLGMWLDRALRERPLYARRWAPPMGPAIVLAAAGIEELLQQLSPRRDTSLHDYAGDVAGVVLFTWLARVVARRSRQG